MWVSSRAYRVRIKNLWISLENRASGGPWSPGCLAGGVETTATKGMAILHPLQNLGAEVFHQTVTSDMGWSCGRPSIFLFRPIFGASISQGFHRFLESGHGRYCWRVILTLKWWHMLPLNMVFSLWSNTSPWSFAIVACNMLEEVPHTNIY